LYSAVLVSAAGDSFSETVTCTDAYTSSLATGARQRLFVWNGASWV
jgi:hypothetical protein